jgi:hypothetical protein
LSSWWRGLLAVSAELFFNNKKSFSCVVTLELNASSKPPLLRPPPSICASIDRRPITRLRRNAGTRFVLACISLSIERHVGSQNVGLLHARYVSSECVVCVCLSPLDIYGALCVGTLFRERRGYFWLSVLV